MVSSDLCKKQGGFIHCLGAETDSCADVGRAACVLAAALFVGMISRAVLTLTHPPAFLLAVYISYTGCSQ